LSGEMRQEAIVSRNETGDNCEKTGERGEKPDSGDRRPGL
jgi:hypothetical protein